MMMMMMMMMTVDLQSAQYPCKSHAHGAVMLSKRQGTGERDRGKGKRHGTRESDRQGKETWDKGWDKGKRQR